MKRLALLAIRLYQRFISPYKGYRCAYASHTGNGNCSALGYRVIRRYGVWDGLALLELRLARCGAAYRRPRAALPATMPAALGRQAGSVDCSCDLPNDPSCACDIADAVSECRKRNCGPRRRDERELDIRPRTGRR